MDLRRVSCAFEQVAGTAGGDLHQLVRVHVAACAVGAELRDGAGPGCGHDDAVEATAAELRGAGPPIFERGILGAAADRLGRERRGEPRPAVVLPHVHRLRPRAGGTEQGPDAVAELTPLLLADRAPVRGHVLHVVGAVMPRDVDDLVDVDAVVHVALAPRWPVDRRSLATGGHRAGTTVEGPADAPRPRTAGSGPGPRRRSSVRRSG